MATVHLLYGIENLALTNGQRNQLVTALRALGAENSSPQPARRNHWRTRSDQQAAIFHSAFDDSELTIQAFKDRLATIFNVSAATISHSVLTPTFAVRASTVVTYTRTGTDYLRVAVFGGIGASNEESRIEAIAYIAANAAAWAVE